MEDANAEYFMLTVMPENKDATEFEQAENLFQRAHNILDSLGCGFSDTIRTWLYAQKILDWYDDLNKARNAFFEEHDIYNQLVPASTGIGAMNPYDKAMATQVLALLSKNENILVQKAASPLQCPALDYKSSFSRGIKLDAPDHRRLYVSGTASINQTGETVYIGDTAAQIKKTVQVLEAILKEAGMDWSDVVSSLIYFRRKEELGMFDEFCREYGLDLPHVKLHADICRDNLLFEVELDAMKRL
jgi:enamine deaminase RidA (YjgF/YER057c/UK114 family)